MAYRMSTRPYDCRGMTLVELLVAGVISVILAGVILVIYRMYSTRVRESTAGLALQMQYAVVAEQIAAYTHEAHKVWENLSTSPEPCQPTGTTTDSLFFYDAAGQPFAGIKILNDSMYEYLPDGGGGFGGHPFTVGAGVVRVDSAGSFELNGCRNVVTLDLRLKLPEGDTVFYVGPAKEVFVCRN